MARDDDVPVPLTALPAWLARQAREMRDGEVVLDGLGRSLVAAGLPIRLLGFGTTSLSPTFRGITLTWQEGQIDMEMTPHDDPDFDNTPIAAAMVDGRPSMRWRLEHGEGSAAIPRLAARRAQGCTDYLLDILAFPPGTALRGVGLFYATDRPGGFTDDEAAMLEGLRDVYSLAVLRYALSHALENMLEAYLGPRTAGRVLSAR